MSSRDHIMGAARRLRDLDLKPYLELEPKAAEPEETRLVVSAMIVAALGRHDDIPWTAARHAAVDALGLADAGEIDTALARLTLFEELFARA